MTLRYYPMGQRFYITSAVLDLGVNMPRRPVRRKDRAVSPVIATIILVAIAIVMAIAVAYWALGLGGTFTKYEKIEIMAMYSNYNTTAWNVTAKVRNTGSAPATINLILINGKPLSAINDTVTSSTSNKKLILVFYDTQKINPEASPVTLNPGDECTLTILIHKGTYKAGGMSVTFRSGMALEVTFHTASGSDYPKVVTLT